MYCDLPKFARCCFCFPLRCGILAFAYINVLVSTLILGIISWNVHSMHPIQNSRTVVPYHGVILFVHAAVPLILNCVEIIFTIILIVGAHLKNEKLFKIYFWYTVTTTVASVVLFFALLDEFWYFTIVDSIPLMIVSIILHVYLLLLIWSELKKLRNSEKFRFVNLTTEMENAESLQTETV